MLSAATKDYLTTICRLGRSGELVSNASIADRLKVTAPSVTGMIRHLAAQGLVVHVPYHGSRLTVAGEAEALRVVRRHRVLEAYLVQVLGYAPDRVHEQAGRLEHAISDELIDRMTRVVGEALRADAHGAPIPDLGRVQ